jgi:hypothetical protein
MHCYKDTVHTVTEYMYFPIYVDKYPSHRKKIVKYNAGRRAILSIHYVMYNLFRTLIHQLNMDKIWYDIQIK